jgi:hypothetical protein
MFTLTDTRLQDSDAIRIDVSKPHPDKPGHLTRERWVTQEEFFEQVKQTLKATPVPEVDVDCDAYSLAESFYIDHDIRKITSDELFKDEPYGRIFVMASDGNCEGELVRLVLLREDNTYVSLGHIKYIHNITFAFKIAQRLTEALRQGLFN